MAIPAGAPIASAPAGDSRYGLLGLLDHRSRYGQFWFPEPLRMGEVDVDNEIRFDWLHQEGKGLKADEVKAELEKSFGLLTVEVEVPYVHETSYDGGKDTEEGVGNVEISARHPIFQYVSADDFIDNTVGVAFEIGIPTNSPVSQNTELVPKLFDALRLGEHLSIQTLVGWSFLLGGAPEGGNKVFEYAAVLGYDIDHQQLPLPGVERITPILELVGETALNREEAGHNVLTGTAGVRVNLNAIGGLQPRLGVGYVFPIDKGGREEFRWGIITSLVFEY